MYQNIKNHFYKFIFKNEELYQIKKLLQELK